MKTFAIFSLLFVPLCAKPAASSAAFEPFESDGFGEWKEEGPAFGKSPTAASPAGLNGTVKDYAEQYYVSSAHGGDISTGTLTSPEFKISKPYLGFLISGGRHPGKTAVQLFIEGELAMQNSGKNDLKMRPVVWNLASHLGKSARIKIIDLHRGAWGIINADHFIFSDQQKLTFPATAKTETKDTLTSNNTIPGLQFPAGAEVKIFTENSSSGLYSPTALTIDEQGLVYVAETHRFRSGIEDNRDHLYWIHDDIAAMTTDDRRKMHQKWDGKKITIADMTRLTEKIRVLVDTDGDGVADEHKIFADKFNDLLDGTAAGIMAFEGTLYFACIPKIWALRDENSDLVADDYETLQDGFGVRVSFSGHDLNGFALGPDGRLYTTIGDRGFSFTTKEGRQYSYPGQGAILRFEPDGSHMEVVHTGLRNPKEIAFDKWGTGVSVDNNSDQGDQARIVILTEGADSGWHMGHQVLHSFHRTVEIPERPLNHWMQEKMWAPFNEAQPAYILPPAKNLTSGPSGLAYHPGTGFNLMCKDQFLICDYRGSAAASSIWHFGLESKGAGFQVSQSGQFNVGTAVTDVEWGYDGKIYISDFISGWTSHDEGRVYTLSQTQLNEDPTVQEVATLFKNGFDSLTSAKLAELLRHPDQRVRLRAQFHLAKRDDALAHFTGAANQRLNELERLHGIWGIGMLARQKKSTTATNFLSRFLSHSDEKVRGQAAQALGEAPLQDSAILIPLLQDPSERVRALAALALGRKPNADAAPLLIQLLEENNNEDPTLRHAGIMGLISCASADEIVALSQHPSPAVRLAAVVALRRLGDDRLVQFLTDSDTRVADETIRAIHDTSMEKVRPALAALLDDYAPGGNGRELTQMMLRRLIYSAFRLGGEKNIARLARVAANKNLSLVERTDITRLFGLWPKPPRVDHSTGVFHPLEERDPESFKKALAAYLPIMLSAESSILGKVMGLADQYSIPLDDLDSGTLTRLVRDEKINAATRVAALNLILKTNPDEAGELLAESASSNNDQLASAALKIAASRDPAANVATLKGALASKSVARRQEAWKVISKLPAEFSVPLLRDSLAELTAGKGDLGSALELLQAARANKKEPVISKLLADYQASIKDANLETRWAPSLAGGNPRNGFKIFQSHGAAQCMRCHRYKKGHSEGGNAGPNLAGVARRHDAKGLLASLLAPSAEIATGFGLATLTFHNQTQKTGMILRDGENTLDFQEAETVWKISKDKITHTATLPSAMPTMEGILNPREIRDVVAWLLTLTKESGETSATYETTALVLEESPEPKQKIESNQVSDTIDPVIMETGKSLYDKAGSCITCHQATGAGIPGAFPPLTESDWVSGPIENLIRIQLHGLQGEIQVNGATYNGMMPAVPDAIFPQTDENIAAVLTYVRNSFGNSAPAVTPEMVATIREEGPRGPLTMDDVVDLTGPDRFIKEVSAIVGGEQATPIALAEIPSTGLGASVWGIAAFLIIGGLSLGAALKMKASS